MHTVLSRRMSQLSKTIHVFRVAAALSLASACAVSVVLAAGVTPHIMSSPLPTISSTASADCPSLLRHTFNRYLVDRSGKRVQSFDSAVEPSQRDFVATLERLLADKPGI